MPVITQIAPQKRHANFFSIHVDGAFSFSLAEKDLNYLDLKTGTALTDKELEKLVRTYSLQKAKDYAYRLVARKTYAEKELEEKLLKRFNGKICAELIAGLKEYGYLNDEKTVHAYAEAKVRQRPMGRLKLRQILWNKKFSEPLIDKALEKVYRQHDELDMARKLFRKHFKGKGKRDSRTLNRMKNYLAGNGFDFEIIKKVLFGTDEES